MTGPYRTLTALGRRRHAKRSYKYTYCGKQIAYTGKPPLPRVVAELRTCESCRYSLRRDRRRHDHE